MWPTCHTATWSSDGSAIVFANAKGIFSVNADSGEKTPLYSWPAGQRRGPDFLKLSPDGKYALAAGHGLPDGFRALVVPLAGGTQGIQITSVDAFNAEWSPTEDVAAVIADWCKPEARLLLVNPDGSIRSTVEPARSQIPRFSADGSMIAYEGSGPQEKGMQDQFGIVVRSAGGQQRPRLVHAGLLRRRDVVAGRALVCLFDGAGPGAVYGLTAPAIWRRRRYCRSPSDGEYASECVRADGSSQCHAGSRGSPLATCSRRSRLSETEPTKQGTCRLRLSLSLSKVSMTNRTLCI